MKVYYRTKDFEFKKVGDFDYNEIAERQFVLMMEKTKYRVMWALRSIEDLINDEGGMIIINEHGQIETKEFSEETTEKIAELLLKEYGE